MATLAEVHAEVRTAIEAGSLEHSRRLCDSILSARPDNLETLLLMAEIDLESGASRKAIRGLERVLGGDAEAYLACAGMAIAYEGLRDPAAAVHWLSRAIDLNPINQQIRHEHDRVFGIAYPGRVLSKELSELAAARSLLRTGFPREAIDAYRMAHEREPGRVEIQLGLAEALWATNRLSDAEAVCADALALAPRSVKANAILACIAAETGDVSRGQRLLADVHAQDPEGRIAGHMLGQTPLAEWAISPVDVPLVLNEAAASGEGTERPAWTHWMRTALWQMLRIVWPEMDWDPDTAIDLPPAAYSDAPRELRPSTGPLGRRLSQRLTEAGEACDPATTAEMALVSQEIERIPLEEVLRRLQSAAAASTPVEPNTNATDVGDATEVIEWTAPLESPPTERKTRSRKEDPI